MKFLFLAIVLIASEPAFARSDVARVFAARSDLAPIKIALDVFAADCGRYPTTSEGFAILINCPTNIPSGQWLGPYLKAIPTDPWGNVYVYHCPGKHNTNGFDLYSCGCDGISRSDGDDPDNINNWDPNSPQGGKDFGMNSYQLLLFRIEGSSAYPVLLLGITLVLSARFVPRVRGSFARHPTANFIWDILSFRQHSLAPKTQGKIVSSPNFPSTPAAAKAKA